MSRTNPSEPRRRLAYSVPETAELLNVSESTVWRLVNDGTLRAIRLRGSTRIAGESLHRAIGSEGAAQ